MVDHIIKCFIQSIAIDNRLDYWKDIRSKSKIEYIELNTIEKIERGSNIGQGFIINDYVITCRHIIGSEEKTKCFYFEDNKIVSKQLIFIGEIKNYDICVLKFHDSRVEYFDFLRTFEKLLKNNEMTNNLKPEEMIDVSYYDFNQTENKLKNIESMIEYIETKNINLKSMLVPRIPIHFFKLNKITHGSSGTLAFHDKIPIGMIDFKTKDKIGIIPIEIIYELLKSKLNINHSTIKFKYDIVEIEDDCYKYGLILRENIILGTNTKKVTLKSNYVILEMSNCAITENGILNKQLNMYVDLDFHFLLQDESVDICYNKNKNESEDDKNIFISVNKIQINNTKLPISIDHNHKYYFYKGLIFTELSEELIYYYKKNRSIEDDRYVNNFWKMNLSDKIVVIIDRQEEILKKESIRYKELIKLLDEKHVIILRKVGRNNITSLEKLKDIIDSKKQNTIVIEKETSSYHIIL